MNAVAGHLYAGTVAEEAGEAGGAGGGEAAGGANGGDADALAARLGDADLAADADAPAPSSDAAGARELQFSPERGNVLFASAVHGWAFSLDDFARLYSTKLAMRQATLQATLWGELTSRRLRTATAPRDRTPHPERASRSQANTSTSRRRSES